MCQTAILNKSREKTLIKSRSQGFSLKKQILVRSYIFCGSYFKHYSTDWDSPWEHIFRARLPAFPRQIQGPFVWGSNRSFNVEVESDHNV